MMIDEGEESALFLLFQEDFHIHEYIGIYICIKNIFFLNIPFKSMCVHNIFYIVLMYLLL